LEKFMPTNLVSFYNQNQLGIRQETYTTRLEKDYKREFKDLRVTQSPDYIINLKEKGIFNDDYEKLLEIFTLFRTISIHQASMFLLPQYSVEAHQHFIAPLFARLYYLHFIRPIDIEEKLKKNPAHYPLPSLTFVLDAAGARFLASSKDKSLSDIGWTKSNYFGDKAYGVHNIIVTELIIRLTHLVRLLQMVPSIGIEYEVASEWEGRIFHKGGTKKVIARPDYTIRLKFQEGESNPVVKTFFLEYDNGTESLDIVLKKLTDYHMAYTAGAFPLGSPANTSLAFIFNDSRRATRFVKLVAKNIKREFMTSLKKIYVNTLDNVYQKGFFSPDWICVDATQKSGTDDGSGDSSGSVTNRESTFPEIEQKLAENDLYSPLRGMYEDNQVQDENYFLKMELEKFIEEREILLPAKASSSKKGDAIDIE